MQLHLTFKDAPGVQVSMSHMALLELAATALVEVVKGNLPHVVRYPGDAHVVRLSTPFEGLAYCDFLVGVVRRAYDQEQEALRKAGCSPRSEEANLELDAAGNPVAIRKVFRY